MSKVGLTSCCAAALCAVPSMAFAQDASPQKAVQSAEEDRADTGEIIVTARKLGETLRDAPLTVQVLQESSLTDRGAVIANQLSGVVPGLVQMSGFGGVPSTTFRGVGSNSAGFNVESSVAMYYDGVYLGRSRDYIVPMYDVDHVEFIKGTQATLLGKNATLGAISIVNRAPTNTFGVDVSYKHTFNVEGNRIDAAVNLPLTDTLSVRVAGLYDQSDGYYRNLLTGKDRPGVTTYSGRLSLLWQPASGASVKLTYQHDDRREKGQALELLQDPLGSAGLRERAVGQTVFDTAGDRAQASGSAAFGTAPAGPEPFDNQVANRLNLIATVPVGDHILTAQSAYVHWNAAFVVDYDLTQANLFPLSFTPRNRQFTQEIRLASPSDARFKYLIGGFFYYNRLLFDRVASAYSPIGLVPNQSPTSPFQGVYGILSGSYTGHSEQDTTAYSIFGSATFDVTDTFNVTAGLRNTWENKKASYFRTGVGFYGTTATPPIPQTNLSLSESALDYNVGVQFKPHTEIMLYASHSKGSKSSGFQENPTVISAASYSGEQAYTTEVGAKIELSSRVNFSLAIFNTSIKDFQANYTVPVGGVSVSFVGNADLRTRGIDFDVTAKVADGFTVSAAGTYADSKFRSFLGGTVGGIAGNAQFYPGMRAPRAPLFTGQIEANYIQPITERLDLALTGKVEHVSSFYLVNYNYVQGDGPISKNHQNVTFRAALSDREAGWELALIGDNVLGQRWNVFATRVTSDGIPTNTAPALGQRAYLGTVNRPRTIALQARWKY